MKHSGKMSFNCVCIFQRFLHLVRGTGRRIFCLLVCCRSGCNGQSGPGCSQSLALQPGLSHVAGGQTPGPSSAVCPDTFTRELAGLEVGKPGLELRLLTCGAPCTPLFHFLLWQVHV